MWNNFPFTPLLVTKSHPLFTVLAGTTFQLIGTIKSLKALSNRFFGKMKPNLKNETVMRVQEMTNEPISRGMDKAINQV